MPRSWKAILACVFLVSFLALGSAPVQATTYSFTATVHPGYETMLTDFTLTYVDAGPAPNGRFALGELVTGTFAGGSYAPAPGAWHPITAILVVPRHNAVTSPFTDGQLYDSWSFVVQYGGGELTLLDTYWTYAQTEVVPLPPSVFLLGSGLLGLVGWRRFRKG